MTGKIATEWAEVDERGRLVIDAAVAERYGLKPGARMRLDLDPNSIRFHRPVTHLAKLYIEPTNWCNFDCRTCMRNNWQVETGFLAADTFERIMDGLEQVWPRPTVVFSGIGEPLSHGRIATMVKRVHDLGCRTELITNGTLLTEKRARSLIDAGLDLLWVSLDGARPESYADVRLGAELPNVLENLWRFIRMRTIAHHMVPEVGIAFVAMKRNIADLPDVLQLGIDLGARQFSVSNVLPVTAELQGEMLYARARNDLAYIHSTRVPRLSLPRMDFDETTRDALFKAFRSGYNVSFGGQNWAEANDVCNYVEGGAMSVAWTGDVSPCWPLMHAHTSYLHGKPRMNHGHAVGNVRERGLLDIWLDPEYVAYRERVQGFEFAPCTFCGGCDLSEANQEDCLGNTAPACGGCLWAQGVIQCP